MSFLVVGIVARRREWPRHFTIISPARVYLRAHVAARGGARERGKGSSEAAELCRALHQRGYAALPRKSFLFALELWSPVHLQI
jgi:hypothetical protein